MTLTEGCARRRQDPVWRDAKHRQLPETRPETAPLALSLPPPLLLFTRCCHPAAAATLLPPCGSCYPAAAATLLLSLYDCYRPLLLPAAAAASLLLNRRWVIPRQIDIFFVKCTSTSLTFYSNLVSVVIDVPISAVTVLARSELTFLSYSLEEF